MFLGWDVILVHLDPVVSILEALGLEWWLADQECVEDATQRPDVHLIAVAFLTQYLGMQIIVKPQ